MILMRTQYDSVLCLLVLPVLTSTTLCANTLTNARVKYFIMF